jgi:hypothetical protein
MPLISPGCRFAGLHTRFPEKICGSLHPRIDLRDPSLIDRLAAIRLYSARRVLILRRYNSLARFLTCLQDLCADLDRISPISARHIPRPLPGCPLPARFLLILQVNGIAARM